MSSSRFRMSGVLASSSSRVAIRWPARRASAASSSVVDVEFGGGGAIYALAHGDFPAGNPPGSPALPDTGSLVEVNADGSLSPVVTNLNLPTSLEMIGDTAYIVSLAGEISTIRLRSHCRHP